MSIPSGWYDDPQDPTQLRYWDGVVWTDHRTPKAPPAPPVDPVPPAPAPGWSSAPGAGTAGPQNVGIPQDPYAAPGSMMAGAGVPQAPQPMPGTWTQAPTPAYPSGWGGGPTTPDGVPLASVWARLAARIIDWVIMGVLVALAARSALSAITSYYSVIIEEAVREAEAGREATLPEPGAVVEALAGPFLQISLTALIVGVLYESVFLLLWGATPGKKVLGLQVRLKERPGRLPVGSVIARQFIWLSGQLPYVGVIGNIVAIVDALWPLWDKDRQALHDKLAKTQVVKTR